MTRPTFTIRDLFWLVLMCALAGGCHEGSKGRQVREGIDSVEEHAKRIETAAEPTP